MTTTKSYSEQRRLFFVFRWAMKRLIPFTVALAILLFLCISVVNLADFTDDLNYGYTYGETFTRRIAQKMHHGVYMEEEHQILVSILMAFAAGLYGIVSMGFIHSKKQVDLYHSLPVKRQTLLTGNLMAAMASMMGAYLAIILITMVPQGFYYCIRGGFPYLGRYLLAILMDLLTQFFTVGIICLFVIFVAVNVGTLFDTFATALAVGFAPLVTYMLCGFIWSETTYGSSFDPSIWILMCCPFLFLFIRMDFFESVYLPTFETYSVYITDYKQLSLLLFFALLACALLYWAAVMCYRRRRSEIASLAQVGGVFQTIVKCFVSFLGGVLFYAIFNSRPLPLQLFAILFGSVLGGVIAELILSRGLKYLFRNIRWIAGAGAFTCILLIVSSFDLIGYTTRVPSARLVNSVEVQYNGRFSSDSYSYYGPTWTLTDRDSIETVIAAHRIAVENQPDQNRNDRDLWPWGRVEIEYKMLGGTTLKRQYYEFYSEARLQLVNLENKEDYIRAAHPIFRMDSDIYPVDQSRLVDSVYFYDSYGRSQKYLDLSDRQIDQLLDALQLDMLGESIQEITYPTRPAYGFVRIDYNRDRIHRYNEYYSGDTTSYILLTSEYTRTITLLQQYDLELEELMDVTDSVERVVITRVPTEAYNQYRIFTFTPGNMSTLTSDYYSTSSNDYLADSIDREEIRAVTAAAKNQMLITDQPLSMGLLRVSFQINGRFASSKYIMYEDLPPELQTQVRRQLPSVFGSSF